MFAPCEHRFKNENGNETFSLLIFELIFSRQTSRILVVLFLHFVIFSHKLFSTGSKVCLNMFIYFLNLFHFFVNADIFF